MSHFAVTVIGDNPEAKLQPFDESIRVDEYKVPVYTYWWITKEEWDLKPDMSQEEIYARWVSRHPDSNEVRIDEEGTIYEMSTYSPMAKWDYYVLGGRYTGFYLLKYGAEGTLGPRPFSGPTAKFGHVDQAYKGDIDFEMMRREAGDKAAELWDSKIEPIVSVHGLPPAFPWIEINKANSVNDRITAMNIRDIYWAGPCVSALKKAGVLGVMGDPHELYGSGREAYIEDAYLGSTCTYALITDDGSWCAPGEMGLFGLSSESENDRRDFVHAFNNFIDDLEDDTLISLYDCHI